MAESKSLMSPIDCNGQTVLPPVGFSPDPPETLARHEMESTAADIRYAPQSWRNAFNDLPEEVGPSVVVQVGQKIGRFGFIELGGSRARLVCASASPCEFDQRVIADLAQKYATKTRAAMVTHDPTRPCRQKGGPSCTYLVSW